VARIFQEKSPLKSEVNGKNVRPFPCQKTASPKGTFAGEGRFPEKTSNKGSAITNVLKQRQARGQKDHLAWCPLWEWERAKT